MRLHARRTARTLAGLTGAALLLGMVPGTPATAAPEDDRTVPEIGLTWSELQGFAARFEATGPGGSSSGSAASPVRKEFVRDPIGDVEKPTTSGPARTERVGAQHADLTGLTYRTPARVGGSMTVKARWADYRNARQPGTRRQFLLTYFGSPQGDFVLYVGNRRNKVFVFDLTADSMDEGRIRPERVEVERSFGRGGTIRVTMSTEWLSMSRVRFASIGIAGSGENGVDETRPSGRLEVGPRNP